MISIISHPNKTALLQAEQCRSETQPIPWTRNVILAAWISAGVSGNTAPSGTGLRFNQGGRGHGWINLGAGWTDGSGATESGLSINGKIEKLSEDVIFEYDPAHFMEPWQLRTAFFKPGQPDFYPVL